jgi:UTP:GlnB (protein PII) uridylyltransferase
LNADDRDDLDFLVRQHLYMYHLATRRDIHDEKLVTEFAAAVRTPAALRKLYLLTFGDMCATNPKLWTNWHDMLMGELYVRTVDVFERRVYVEQVNRIAPVVSANAFRNARVSTVRPWIDSCAPCRTGTS